MSDSFLYNGDDAVIMSELQHCCVAVRECSGISSESEAGLSVVTLISLAPECGLTQFNIPMEMYMLKACTCIYVNPYLTVRLTPTRTWDMGYSTPLCGTCDIPTDTDT